MATRRTTQEATSSSRQAIPSSANLLVPALVVVLALLSFGIGVLWQKVNNLENGGANLGVAGNPAAGQPAAPAPSDPTVSVKADTLNLDEVQSNEHIRGDKNAKITILEYSDLQCPFCKQYHPTLQQAMTEYDGKIRWVYRHFPLESLHPVALKAAVGSECAAKLGGEDAFWKFVDATFAGESSALTEAKLADFAVTAGVNRAAFQTCLDQDQTLQAVRDDQASGTKAGVQGTPASYVLDDKGNAWVIGGAVPYATLKQILDKALQ